MTRDEGSSDAMSFTGSRTHLRAGPMRLSVSLARPHRAPPGQRPGSPLSWRRITSVNAPSASLTLTVCAAGPSKLNSCTSPDRRTPSAAGYGVVFLQRVSAWHGPPPSCLQQQCVCVFRPAQSTSVSPAGLFGVSPSVSPSGFTNCHRPRLTQVLRISPLLLHRFLTPTRRQGLAGRSNKSNPQQGKGGNGTPSPTTSGPYSPSAAPGQTPNFPSMPHSPALSSAMSFESQATHEGAPSGSRRPPFFFREEYSSLIVRGNFMTLAAKPNLVDEGEWLAHQGMSWSLPSRDTH